jgi:O-antigen/teichoic acid export membrane protein
MLSGFIGGGPVAIGLIYDERYSDAGWMVQLVAVSAWFGTPEAANTAAVLARGKPAWLAIGNAAKLLGMFALIPLGFYLGDFPGALAGYVASELFRYTCSTIAMHRLELSALRQDIGYSAVVAVASLTAWLTARGLAALHCPVLLQAFGVFVAVSLVWLRWLSPYLRTGLDKVRGRFARA